MNKKFNVGVCAVAGILGFVAVGLYSRYRLTKVEHNENIGDNDQLSEIIVKEIGEEES